MVSTKRQGITIDSHEDESAGSCSYAQGHEGTREATAGAPFHLVSVDTTWTPLRSAQ